VIEGTDQRMHTQIISHTRLIDRTQELADIHRLLDDPTCRLITLVGLGGAGKSRLAVDIMQHNATHYPHGVYMLELAALETPAEIPLTIGAALGIQLTYEQGSPEEQVVSFIKDRHLLLILDNMDHLQGGGVFITRLLNSAPQVQVLVTSRETLNIPGEIVYEIRGLAVPTDISSIIQSPTGAVALFVDRARYVQPGFTLDQQNIHSVIRICQLVEGLPLGIELAVAWIRAISCDTFLAQLEHSLDVLTSRSLNTNQHHISLRATFEQSWTMLAPQEQELLMCLTVLRGKFSYPICEQVAGASTSRLAVLVDKSMIQTHAEGWYSLHPVIRQYAHEKLADSPALWTASLDQHASYFLKVLAEQLPRLKNNGMIESLALLERLLDNIRPALQYAVSTRRPDLILPAVDSLGIFFRVRGQPSLFLETFQWAVDHWETDPPNPQTLAVQGHLFGWLGVAYSVNDDPRQGLDCLEQSVALFRTLNDRSGLAFALLETVTIYTGTLTNEPIENYLSFADESIVLYREIGDDFGLATALKSIGAKYSLLGRHDQARRCLEGSLTLGRRHSNPYIIMNANYLLSHLEFHLGNLSTARRLCEEGLLTAKALQDRQMVMHILGLRLLITIRQGDGELARQYAQEKLDLALTHGTVNSVVSALNSVGNTERHFGDHAQARAVLYRALELAEARHLPDLLSTTCLNLVTLVSIEQNYDEARRLTEKALQIARESGNVKQIATILNNWGFALYEAGDYAEARQVCQEALDLWEQNAFPISGFPSVLLNLGHIAAALGEKTEALALFEQALRLCWNQKRIPLVLEAIIGLARLLAVNGRFEYPVELVSFAVHRPECSDDVRRVSAPLSADLQRRLARHTFQEAFERGKTLALDVVVENLLAHPQIISSGLSLDLSTLETSLTVLTEPLSQRELEVLRLVAQGLSNQDIADRLFVAVGTVKTHVWKIREKLGAKNRTQAVERARQFNIL